MDSIKKVNNLCKQVLKLTEQDFEAVEQMQKEQSGYSHPLKNATAAKYNELGKHNKRVIEALKKLHLEITKGEPITKKKVSKI